MAEPPRQPPEPANEDYGSIIERFRGTEWESRPEAPRPPPENPMSRMLVVAGAVILVIAGTVVLALLPWQGPAATPIPSRVILTPPPTPGPGDLIEAAFWQYVANPTLGYHEAITAVESKGGPYPVTERLSLDVYAEDFSGTADIKAGRLLKLTHLVLLRSGGTLYAKFRGDKHWQESVIANQFSGLHTRPFLSLEDPRQLVYDEAVVRNGETVHRLVSTELYRPGLTRLIPFGVGSAPSAQIRLELLVTADGVPLEARFTAHVPADLVNGTKASDISTVYRFSQQGEVEPIPSPRF